MATRTIPGHVDSIGKMLSRLAIVSKDKVIHNGKPIIAERDSGKVEINPPDRVLVSPSVMRRFDCIAGCTACCLPFTLDFTPEEFDNFPWTEEISDMAVEKFGPRWVSVNGEVHKIYSYKQYLDPSCPFLRTTRITAEGHPALGCGFWTESNSTQPLECAAAPQLLMTTRGVGTAMIMKRPFGRGWAWKDKPQCHFDPVLDKVSKIPEEYDLSNEIMLLQRYDHWATYFGIRTWIPEIVAVLQDFPARLRASGLASVVVVER